MLNVSESGGKGTQHLPVPSMTSEVIVKSKSEMHVFFDPTIPHMGIYPGKIFREHS